MVTRMATGLYTAKGLYKEKGLYHDKVRRLCAFWRKVVSKDAKEAVVGVESIIKGNR